MYSNKIGLVLKIYINLYLFVLRHMNKKKISALEKNVEERNKKYFRERIKLFSKRQQLLDKQ